MSNSGQCFLMNDAHLLKLAGNFSNMGKKANRDYFFDKIKKLNIE